MCSVSLSAWIVTEIDITNFLPADETNTVLLRPSGRKFTYFLESHLFCYNISVSVFKHTLRQPLIWPEFRAKRPSSRLITHTLTERNNKTQCYLYLENKPFWINYDALFLFSPKILIWPKQTD